MPKITPWLWFDTEAEEAAEFYTSVFPNSEITDVTYYGSAGPRPEGTVLTVTFVLDGQELAALNGGPQFRFNEAVSFLVDCKDQDEVDYYWERLTSDGGEEGPCGWCKDRFGLSWQVVPSGMDVLLSDPDPERAQRAMEAMLTMRKLDIAELERAAAGPEEAEEPEAEEATAEEAAEEAEEPEAAEHEDAGDEEKTTA
jgi:predicted 3-demethylubiquinone-9 3-methyltransferase (glyoxalase superfamily)